MRFYNKDQYSIDFKESIRPTGDCITMGEFFAGGGGWTSGVERLEDVKTVWILNHDAVAIKTNAYHHKGVKVFWADFFSQDEHLLDIVDYIHASVECDEHTAASGRRKKNIGNYVMGWELVRYLKYLQPLVISIENVPEFKKWGPTDENDEPIRGREGEEFERWKSTIINLGYEYCEDIRNAADDGIAQRRVRYFGFFFKPGINISFPESTHNKEGNNGKKPWIPCKNFINLNNEGQSIFGRQFNKKLPRHLRKPLVHNSLARIAAGIKKYYPEFNEILVQYYGGDPRRSQSLNDPIYTIPTENRHQLISIRGEKLKFIMDHCHTDHFNKLEEPLRPQLTRQTKQKITFESFLCQYYGQVQTQDIEMPLNTIVGRDCHQIIRIEKLQFIVKYFNSNGNPGRNIESIEDPISPILTEFKHQLITLLDGFDIKARFLNAEELAGCSSFEPGYFTDPNLKLSQKNAVVLIGNAVPPLWATKIVGHNIQTIKKFKKEIDTNQKLLA